MKKFLLAAIMLVGLAGLSYAAVEVKSSGTVVDRTETLNFTGPTVTKSGTDVNIDFSTQTGSQTITGDVAITGTLTNTGAIVTDGTIYTAKITSDGAIYAPVATIDPCATLGRGYIFFNTSGQPCYCNAAGADVLIYSASTACM